MKLPFRGVKNFSTLVVLYTAFSFCANTVLSEDNKFSVLEEFKVGEMKKLILHESPKAVSEEVFILQITILLFCNRCLAVLHWLIFGLLGVHRAKKRCPH